jgi:hypothetical protein
MKYVRLRFDWNPYTVNKTKLRECALAIAPHWRQQLRVQTVEWLSYITAASDSDGGAI